MIRKLTCRNFKSWREPGPVGLAPITVFFGGNGTGKTSLLRPLLLLKQTAASPELGRVIELEGEPGSVAAGSFLDLCFGRDPRAPMTLGLEWQLPFELHVNDPGRHQAALFHGNALEVATTLGWRGEREPGRAVVEQVAYTFAGAELGLKLADEDKLTYELFHTHRDFKPRRKSGQPSRMPAATKCYGFPAELSRSYENVGFLRDFETQLEQRLAQVVHLGPRRAPTCHRTAWSGERPADVGRCGERVIEALLAARAAGKTLPGGRGRKRQTVEERVVEQLRMLGLADGFELRPASAGGEEVEVWTRRHPGAVEVPLAEAGHGLAHVLPTVTLCYHAPEGSTVVLEKPEIALDPAAQAGLADVLVDAVLSHDVQILVASHSEHLLRRLQRRVAEEKLRPRQVAIYLCSREQGESRLTHLPLDRYGAIQSWPEDFLSHELDEISATARAALERQTRSSG